MKHQIFSTRLTGIWIGVKWVNVFWTCYDVTNFVPRLCSVGIMVSESVCVSCATKIKRVWSDLQETGRGVRLESIAAGVLARVGSDVCWKWWIRWWWCRWHKVTDAFRAVCVRITYKGAKQPVRSEIVGEDKATLEREDKVKRKMMRKMREKRKQTGNRKKGQDVSLRNNWNLRT